MAERFLSVKNNTFTILCRKSLMQLLTKEYNIAKSNLIKSLNNKKYVCTTADIWSSNNKSYMGMTVHFIDADKLERFSFMLARKRIKYSHNFENIGKLIYEIHTEKNLNVEKITHTIIDNASNFSKAFNIFKDTNTKSQKEQSDFLSYTDIEILINELDEINEKKANTNTDDENTGDDIVVQVEEFNYEIYNEFDNIVLPNHVRCLSHTLNLLAISDSSKAKNNETYKTMYKDAFGKVHKFWNLLRRSTKASDIVKDIV